MGIYYYNSLVRLKNLARASWSDIEIQLKRRHNLIPNIVETVKGYARHERSTLEEVVKARSKAINSSSISDKVTNEGVLTRALRGLLAIAENYPDLKASENFLNLQNQLNEIEEQISLARRYYNSVVRDYNTRIESFPSNIIASLFAFKKLPYFKLEDESVKEVPEVKF